MVEKTTRIRTHWSEIIIALSLVGVSTVLMLSCTSPELSWDEADYVASSTNSWRFLWSGSDYDRHGHGPMMIYLAKLGQSVLPTARLEVRTRFFNALVASLAIGFLYSILRQSLRTSRAAALVGSCLLLFSVIRIEETNIVGPHHLMLFSNLAIVGLGYQWRDSPSLRATAWMGIAIAFGALSMTYVIPAVLCWIIAVAVAGHGWFAWDRTYLKVSWGIPATLAIATVLVWAIWPPGVIKHVILSNFRWYLHYSTGATLVGSHIVGTAPRWAFLYWFSRLDIPLLLVFTSIHATTLLRARQKDVLASKHLYLAICVAFYFATTLTAHLAGARNLLQFIGVACLATGGLFDEALKYKSRSITFSAVVIIGVAALNLAVLSTSSSYTPFLATDGFRAFFNDNKDRMRESAKAQIYNTPAFNIYRRASSSVVNWDLSEVAWSPSAHTALPADTRYILIPSFFWDCMPMDQPMRRVVAAHWKIAWSYKRDHAWELRLYENPLYLNP